nr:response regulator transcription factor [Patulibacter sp. SYSU D01012]
MLVVEDEAKLAALMARGLRESGHAVDVADTGEEALWRAASTGYDVVLLDVGLPGIDGFETCRLLRADGVTVPVLMLTARGAVDDRIAGLDAGADDYLAKPFDFGELEARLRALARRPPVAAAPVLTAGPLRLDPAARRAWHGDAELELSPKEFMLLETLLRRQGEAVDRLALLEAAWDDAYDARSNVVDVYVGYLRAKVDRPFGTALIATVRGVGYRLEAP